uniref:Uncharacterized protein n=1 Tax=Anguilla anguilla TaxID=7936 RepID=A0A0E9TZ59_ANGAN
MEFTDSKWQQAKPALCYKSNHTIMLKRKHIFNNRN